MMTDARRSEEIEAEAAGWAARIDRGPIDGDDKAKMAAWLAADPRHLGAYARAEAVSATFDRMRALKAPGGVTATPVVSRRAVLGWSSLAAAAVAGVLFVPATRDSGERRYASARGELQQVALAEGSLLTLGTDSEVVVRLVDDSRQVSLLQGSAMFDVAHDTARPFTVTAGPMAITALGTSFSVERDLTGGRVIVREGTVAVARGTDRPELARAGDRAIWTSAAGGPIEVTAIDPVALRRELAWTEGMLAFEGRSIAEAAAAFARYSDIRIVITDPSLSRRTVTGWFSTSDPRGFAHAAAASLGAVAEDRGDTVIIRPAT
jgi:transmembrane sensor